MKNFDRPIKWQSKYHSDDLDQSILREMSSYKMTQNVKMWEYDYWTATYLLMFEKKQKGIPMKLTPTIGKNQTKSDKIRQISDKIQIN